MRTEFDMMGRSESRDGWRAMSATTKVGDRDFLRFCGLEPPDCWAVAVFPARKMGRLAGIVSGWAEPSRIVGERDRHVLRTTLTKGQVAGRNSLLLQMAGVSGKRRKNASARKTGLKHDVQPRASRCLDGTQATQEGRNGGSGSRRWWGEEVGRDRGERGSIR